MPKPANAIERRISQVESHWNKFAENDEARLLRWLGAPEDFRIVDAFYEIQNEEAGETPDFFIRLDAPFRKPDDYGLELTRQFQKLYDDSRNDLKESGIASDWTGPKVEAAENGQKAFAWTLVSFHKYYADLMERLAVYLSPTEISDGNALAKWLAQLLAGNMPSPIRIMMTDLATTPILSKLAEREPKKVVTIPLNLDMPSAMLELSRGESGQMGPDALFRRHMVALNKAAADKDLAGAEASSRAALTIAKEQEWPHMGAVILMMLASVYVAADSPEKALETYSRSTQAAVAARKAKFQEAPTLWLQSRLAEASCRLKMNDHEAACAVYEETAPFAEKAGNTFAAIESWRMAAYCHQALGRMEKFWECGDLGMDIAEKAEPPQRAQTTLAMFGEALMQAAGDDKDRATAIDKRLTELLGPNWR